MTRTLRRDWPLYLALLALIVITAAGCAAFQRVQDASPVRKVILAQDAVAASMDYVAELHRQGKISDDTLRKADAGFDVCYDLIKLARAKALAGDKVGVDDALALVRRNLQLIDIMTGSH